MGEMRQGISGICFHLHFSLRNFTLPSPICLSPTIRSTTSLSPLLLLPLSPWVSTLFHPRKMEELSVELPTQTIPHCEPSKHSDLQFDRLQPSDEDLDQDKKLEFGQFVAREATLDEEYWTVGLQTCLLKAKSANSARIDGEFCKLVVPKFEPADKILISALRSRSQMKIKEGVEDVHSQKK